MATRAPQQKRYAVWQVQRKCIMRVGVPLPRCARVLQQLTSTDKCTGFAATENPFYPPFAWISLAMTSGLS